MPQVDQSAAFRRLERLAFRARPALESVEFDGWVLRFADGYTKRANSVNPQFGSTRPVERKIARCESEYEGRGLPTIFRLTSFSQPPELDDILADAGYTTLDPTLVMRTPLDRPLFRNDRVQAVGPDAWFDAFDRLKQHEPARQRPHRRIVETAEGDPRFAIVERDNVPAACGLGILVDDAVGVFDLFTAEAHRRQGLASAILGSILGWARDRGARIAFLQVHGKNEPAIQLYERFGFSIAYRYWYRIAPNRSERRDA